MILLLLLGAPICQMDGKLAPATYSDFQDRFFRHYSFKEKKKPLLASYLKIPNDARYLRMLRKPQALSFFQTDTRQANLLEANESRLERDEENWFADLRSDISSSLFNGFDEKQKMKIASFLFVHEGLLALRHSLVRDVLAIDVKSQGKIHDALLAMEDREMQLLKLNLGFERQSDDGKAMKLYKQCCDAEENLWKKVLGKVVHRTIVRLPAIPEATIDAIAPPYGDDQ